ncbi:MAG: SDR family NAD(P)-dependent oxidoreductase [Candidatus Lambdaproteobacteria bacterium]|nr:SDR family NAD(P)-dependent oxidoreductase [Candidatus Lambdaproteobacteria bacterium]
MTGASSGIGRATAVALARAGLKLALAARRGERLDALGRELAQGGAAVAAFPTDLRQPPAVLALFEAIRARWSGVDVLVSSAGLGLDAPLAEGKVEDWQELLALNVLAAALCMREAVRDMEARGGGCIVNVSSLTAHIVMRNSAFYSATKHALRALTEGLQKELGARGSPVRVGMVSPGGVTTEFRELAARGRVGTTLRVPAYTPLAAEDIADLVCFMLSRPPRVQIDDVILRGVGQMF